MSKKATWVGGSARSQQYYGLRHGWKWEGATKTRDPVEAMKEVWGDDLDIVTMLALSPQPVERDWRRFVESREVVDLGRNDRVSRRLLRQLEAEAVVEKQLQKRAAKKRVTTVTDEITEHYKTNKTNSLGREIEDNGFFQSFENGYDADETLKLDFFGVALAGIDTRETEIDVMVEELTMLVQSLYEDLATDAGTQGTQGYFYLHDRVRSLIRATYTGELVEEINGWLFALKDVSEAREVIKERKARVRALDWIEDNGVSADDA